MDYPTRAAGTRILLVFLDGVGLAPEGLANPLSSVPMPRLRELLGGPMVSGGATEANRRQQADDLVFRGLDACLGVAGVPQSATGQTSLFTGLNAAALAGEHVAAYPTQLLRDVIAEHSLLKRASEAGARVIFANAHSERFWSMVRRGERRLSASTLTALASGAPIPGLEELSDGRAVLWDITHEIASTHLGYTLPLVTPEQAGTRLALLARAHHLVLYETFLTDLAGHRRLEPGWVLSRLDRFLGALLDALPEDCTLILCSDHGNLEDATTKLHTANPVPLLASGPQADRFRHLTDITGVAPAILEVLASPGSQGAAWTRQAGTTERFDA